MRSLSAALLCVMASLPAAGPTLAQSASPRASAAGNGALTAGTYHCVAAGGVAGTLQLVIRSETKYADRNGKAGDYAYDPKTRKISFKSGAWEGFFGERLAAGKIGISSRPGGRYSTICDLK